MPTPIFREVASEQRIRAGYIEPLLRQPTDPILAAKGFDLAVYDELLRDDQVASTFQQRRLAVVSRELVVEAGADDAASQAAADLLREVIDRLPFDEITDKMLYGIFYGWAVAEVIWAREGSRIVIDAIKVRDRRHFRWDRDRRLRLITVNSPQGELLPDRKFWVFRSGGADDADPYGRGLGWQLYWPVFFKRHGVKFWLAFLDRFGTPPVIGKYPKGDEHEKERLLEALRTLNREAIAAIPDGMVVELIEARRSGTATYGELVERMDAAIAKIVLSQTMTTDPGSSRAQAQVHMEVREEVVKADADRLCQSFNASVARWLTEFNFPEATPPRVWRRVEDDPDLEAIARRDRIIAELGYAPTPDYIRETYGEGWVPVGTATSEPKGASMAEPASCPCCGGSADLAEGLRSRDRIDRLVDMLDDAAQGVTDAWIDRVRQLVESSESLEEVGRRLLELERDLDPRQLADLLQRALVLAELQGRHDLIRGR